TSIEDDPATSGEHYVNDLAVAVTTGQTFVQSIFVKAMPGAERQVVLRVAGNVAGSQSLAFNVTDAACTATSVPSYPYGVQKCLNGWWRIWSQYTAIGDFAAAVFRIQVYKNNSGAYQGEAGKGLFLFGRQVEVGDSVSSYIPAGASAATRAAESIWMPVSAMVEGTLLVTCVPTDPVTGSGNRTHLTLSDGTNSNFARLHVSGSGSLTSSVTKNTAHIYGGTLGVIQAGTTLKRALAFSNADAKHCTNGVLGAPSDSSYQGANSMNQLWLGSLNGSQGFNGTLARVAVYSKRLSDAQLQRLTS
ncbi:phage head spike fiber domain-containing protein, partial [Comamonas thiooxydans]|uniref:phage head spike fiber domain-containing protein n=1 Tax=Comamonas thiooxydans TaxID=363952 RepID=UPI001184B80D